MSFRPYPAITLVWDYTLVAFSTAGPRSGSRAGRKNCRSGLLSFLAMFLPLAYRCGSLCSTSGTRAVGGPRKPISHKGGAAGLRPSQPRHFFHCLLFTQTSVFAVYCTVFEAFFVLYGGLSVECPPNGVFPDKLECGQMPNVMAALPNIGGALCSTPQSLPDAHH